MLAVFAVLILKTDENRMVSALEVRSTNYIRALEWQTALTAHIVPKSLFPVLATRSRRVFGNQGFSAEPCPDTGGGCP